PCVIKQFYLESPPAPHNAGYQKAVQLFHREAQRLEQLGTHPQIPALLAYFTQEGHSYLVQEFIAGQTLAQRQRQQGVFTESQVRSLLHSLLPVLQFVHAHQVIHRDIKPDNLIWREARVAGQGRSRSVSPAASRSISSEASRSLAPDLVLVDFGAAGTAQIAPHATGTKIYSLGYSAPEQESGKACFASDLYSLGVTCITLLTGCTNPLDLYSYSDATWIWQDALRGNPVSESLARLLNRLIAKPINQRYATAEAVLRDLIHPAVALSLAQANTRTRPQPTAPVAAPQTASRPRLVATPPPVASPTQGVSQPQGASQPQGVLLTSLKPQSGAYLCLPRSRSIAAGESQFEVITVDSQGQIIDRRYHQARYFREPLAAGIDLEMVAIPGGRFLMGAPVTTSSDNTALPLHWVTVPPFFMGRFPMTQAQWKALMLTNPAWFRHPDHPVEEVSWWEAVEFCQRLTAKTGRFYRLPSEAEWEYACRAGTVTPFHFGEQITTKLANCCGAFSYDPELRGQCCTQTTPVGSYPPNAFGLYDMHGNVSEWCQDTWHPNYEGAPTQGEAWIDGCVEQPYRVLRGGAWNAYARQCRSSSRNRNIETFRGNFVGFRVVCS
ncbi:SUMF1/EgtB/PvdO family nonheme iron enzyme, partial [Trichothermofontia sp.]